MKSLQYLCLIGLSEFLLTFLIEVRMLEKTV